MTDFAATDVTVTLPAQNVDVFQGVKKASLATITFGDGSLTYNTGGVPLPAIGKFGMKRAIDMLIIQQPASAALQYRYDADNHKLMILDEDNTSGVLAELADTTATAAVSLKVLVIGE